LKKVFIAIIGFIKSRILNAAANCLFQRLARSTRSAIQKHGALKGGALAFWRILRSNVLQGRVRSGTPESADSRLPEIKKLTDITRGGHP
jgi:putative component of membrane protein insertase Oxa1/YidC/SpoIIIJ protein YidD